MRGGISILSAFAFLWCIAAIGLGGRSFWWLIAPLAISAAIVAWARRVPGVGTHRQGAHVNRLVGMWSAIEGVAIGVSVLVLGALHLPQAILPVIAVIVGLHFLPLARHIPVRLYYATGAALAAVGGVGLAVPVAARPWWVGLGAAVVLWTTAVALARGATG